MILVIPAIDLVDEHCVRCTRDAYTREAVYFDDPVKMARLWRLQNARTLHVAGHDGDNQCRRSVLKRICDAVDIPVQLAGAFATIEDVLSAFRAGVYRIVIEMGTEDDLAFYDETLKHVGASRAVACIRSSGGVLSKQPGVTAIDYAHELEKMGCRRIVCSDQNPEGGLTDVNFEALKSLGMSLNRMRITVSGGISGLSDLLEIASLRDVGVDSVVIGRALYENRFSCQQFWCWNYKDELDLSQFTTARLAR